MMLLTLCCIGFAALILLMFMGRYTLRLARTLIDDNALGGNDERCKLLKGMFILLEVPFITLCSLLCFILLRTAGQFIHTNTHDAVFAFYANDTTWICFSVCIGIPTSLLVVQIIFSRILNTHYQQFADSINRSYGFNALLATRVLCIAIIGAATVVLPFAFATYALFDHDGLVERGFLHIRSSHHHYSNVKEVRMIKYSASRYGEVVWRPSHQILFDDGFVWDSRNDSYACDVVTSEKVAQYVASKRGIAITTYDNRP